MSNFRDFDAMLAEKLGGRPTFVMSGEKFTCRAKIPWKKFSALLISLTTGQVEEGKTEMEMTEDFFRMVLIRRDRDRFIELLNADDDEEDDGDEEGESVRVASNQQVGELLNWLLGYYTGKAQENDESSSETPPRSGLPVKSASLNSKTS